MDWEEAVLTALRRGDNVEILEPVWTDISYEAWKKKRLLYGLNTDPSPSVRLTK